MGPIMSTISGLGMGDILCFHSDELEGAMERAMAEEEEVVDAADGEIIGGALLDAVVSNDFVDFLSISKLLVGSSTLPLVSKDFAEEDAGIDDG
mmetsp:Transcript_19806/g.34104  ORF Transcript_19806/g.34104 Transcript_19806/m.34104 type:complete len:94 (-) Transcript_19806:173-454(-)